jgi:hypothetical protein
MIAIFRIELGDNLYPMKFSSSYTQSLELSDKMRSADAFLDLLMDQLEKRVNEVFSSYLSSIKAADSVNQQPQFTSTYNLGGTTMSSDSDETQGNEPKAVKDLHCRDCLKKVDSPDELCNYCNLCKMCCLCNVSPSVEGDSTNPFDLPDDPEPWEKGSGL